MIRCRIGFTSYRNGDMFRRRDAPARFASLPPVAPRPICADSRGMQASGSRVREHRTPGPVRGDAG